MTSRRRFLTALALPLGAALTAPFTRSAAAATTTATRAAAAGKRPVLRSPLSGRIVTGAKPILVVKVDNVAGSSPHAGLNHADIVYVEEVEGGLTRLAAVFSSRLPRTIGPVRSARTDNIQLLKQFGHPEIAYSGANRLVLKAVRGSDLRSVDAESYPGPFRRDSRHRLPHNLFVTNVPALIRLKPGTRAKYCGLLFSDKPANGGLPANHLVVRYRNATLRFDYDATTGHWKISQDGHPYLLTDGSQVFASSVIVQHVKQLQDPYGTKTPFNQTIGHGKATVLRDGRSYDATWRRGSVGLPTEYRDNATKQIVPVRVGTTWIVLLPRNASARATY